MSEQWNACPVVVVVTGIVVVLALVGATAGQKRFHLKNLKTKEMQLGAMVMYGVGEGGRMGCGLWGTGLATAGVLFVEHVLNTHTHTWNAQRAHT